MERARCSQWSPRTSLTVLLLAILSGCAGPGAQDPGTAEEIRRLREDLSAQLSLVRAELKSIRDATDALVSRKPMPTDEPHRPRPPQRPDPAAVFAIPVGDSPVLGPKDAWVTVVEVTDYQCPFCKRVQVTLDQLREEYGDDLRTVVKHNPLPFHDRALPAALAAECAHQQGRFWAIHPLLFENSRALGDQELEGYVRQAGKIDLQQWRKCMTDPETTQRVEREQKLVTSAGARGTPSFFINGRFLSGAQPLERFQALIDETETAAKQSKIPRADYYRRAVEEGGQKP